MPESPQEDLERLADLLVSHWPGSWFAPMNYLAISHVEDLREARGFQFECEREAVQGIISKIGERAFNAQLGDLVNRAKYRHTGEAILRRQQELLQESTRAKDQLLELEKLRLERIDADKKQREIERLEEEKKENSRLRAISDLRQDMTRRFNEDYLSADDHFRSTYVGLGLEEDYARIRREFLKSWIEKNTHGDKAKKFNLDDEQLNAMGETNGNIQVIARAGSGKTSTAVFRTFFLMKHCAVKPSQIMLLAFNRLAATEIRRRLLFLLAPEGEKLYSATLQEKQRKSGGFRKISRVDIEHEAIEETRNALGIEVPFALTFHALARAVVQPSGTILHDDNDFDDETLSLLVQTLVDSVLADELKRSDIRALLMAHFKADWEKVVGEHYNGSKAEILEWRRSLPKQSIDGNYFKSTGEKIIADFLFENSIGYIYEKNFWWNSQKYQPDFTILNTAGRGAVIEYFGLAGDPAYDLQTLEKKKYWSQNKEWNFVSLYPQDLSHNGVQGFKENLRLQLLRHQIPMRTLSDEEIWEKIEKQAILRYTKVVTRFITRSRQLGLDHKCLEVLAKKHDFLNGIESKFVKQAIYIFELYEQQLFGQGDTDFPKLLTDAAAKITSGHSTFNRVAGNGDLRLLKYIFVDEFQDFSYAFDALLKAILSINPELRLFCVGDNWQAINGFAGSDLQYFESFGMSHSNSKILHLMTNHRSDRYTVSFGNHIMRGRGIAAKASKGGQNKVAIAHLGKFSPSPDEKERHNGDLITPALLRLVEGELGENRDVVLLSRTNTIPYFVDRSSSDSDIRKLEGYLAHLRSFFAEDLSKRITISTAHKYKGREKQSVIILDAFEGRYPFIHPEWVFSRILGSDLDSLIDEERRILYVAASRAIQKLIVLSEGDEFTSLIDLNVAREAIQEVRWEGLNAPPAKTKQVLVMVGNAFHSEGGGTYPIRELIKSSGYAFIPGTWPHWRKAYVASNFSLNEVKDEIWAGKHDELKKSGLEVRFVVSPDVEFARYNIQDEIWSLISDKWDLLKLAIAENENPIQSTGPT